MQNAESWEWGSFSTLVASSHLAITGPSHQQKVDSLGTDKMRGRPTISSEKYPGKHHRKCRTAFRTKHHHLVQLKLVYYSRCP